MPDPEVPAHGGLRELNRLVAPALALAVLAAAALLGSRIDRRESPPAEEETSFAPAPEAPNDSPELASSLGSAAPADSAQPPGRLMVARTWANVRAARSTRAGLEAVLTPGDTVVADSLAGDWYRVAFLGDVIGYAHRITLEPAGRRP